MDRERLVSRPHQPCQQQRIETDRGAAVEILDAQPRTVSLVVHRELDPRKLVRQHPRAFWVFHSKMLRRSLDKVWNAIECLVASQQAYLLASDPPERALAQQAKLAARRMDRVLMPGQCEQHHDR